MLLLFFRKQKNTKKKNTTYEKQVSLKNMALIKKLEEILEDPSKTVRSKRFSEKSPIQNVIFFPRPRFFIFFGGHLFFANHDCPSGLPCVQEENAPRVSKKRAPAFFKRIVSVEPVTENVVFVGCQVLPQKGSISMFYPCANSGHKITHQK